MKIYIVSASGNGLQEYCENSRYILYSYFYCKYYKTYFDIIKKIFDDYAHCAEQHKDRILLDSGAFSLQNQNTKYGTSITRQELSEYVRGYVEFIKRYDIRYYMSLDIETIVGFDTCEKITNYMNKETGVKCIPVWHTYHGIEKLKQLSKEYDYIAIGGITNEKHQTNQIKDQFYSLIEFIKSINKNCKVHLLGISHKSAFYCGADTIDITGHFFSIIRKGASRIEQRYPSLTTKLIDQGKIPFTKRNNNLNFFRNVRQIELQNLIQHYKYDLKKVQSKAPIKIFSRRIT